MKKCIFIVLSSFFISASFAEIKLSKIFSDNMMIQQNQPVAIWGSADPNAFVKVVAGAVQVEGRSDNNGKWHLKIPSANGSFEPFTIQIYENGRLAKEINNVLRGEVWIAGGQSNMAMNLKGIKGSEKYVENMKADKVRYFVHPTPIAKMTSMKSGFGSQPCDDFIDGSKWICVDKQNVWDISAVAFIFGNNLMKRINVPVGIVFNAVAGSKMECWVSQQTYETSPNFKVIRDNFNASLKKYDYKKALEIFNAKVKKYNEDKASGKKNLPPSWTVANIMRPWCDSPVIWKSPYMFYNVRVNPMRNYTARGVIWYQGEDNRAEAFADAFRCLITQWREYFNNLELPFICVQLPSYKVDEWAEKRQAQKEVADSMAQVEIIPAIDTGEENDIHPLDKMPIAERLANKALFSVYGVKNAETPCLIQKIDFSKNSVEISFSTNAILQGDLRGFEVLSNGRWMSVAKNFQIVELKSATSRALKGIRIISNDGKSVEGVRYLWKGWAKPNVCLYGLDKSPVFPFKYEKK